MKNKELKFIFHNPNSIENTIEVLKQVCFEENKIKLNSVLSETMNDKKIA